MVYDDNLPDVQGEEENSVWKKRTSYLYALSGQVDYLGKANPKFMTAHSPNRIDTNSTTLKYLPFYEPIYMKLDDLKTKEALFVDTFISPHGKGSVKQRKWPHSDGINALHVAGNVDILMKKGLKVTVPPRVGNPKGSVVDVAKAAEQAWYCPSSSDLSGQGTRDYYAFAVFRYLSGQPEWMYQLNVPTNSTSAISINTTGLAPNNMPKLPF